MPKPVHRRKPEPQHVHKGDDMPCPLCHIGTCIPCYVGKHEECVNFTDPQAVGCACCQEEEFV